MYISEAFYRAVHSADAYELTQLADSASSGVRYAALANPAFNDVALLDQLVYDGNKHVREISRSHQPLSVTTLDDFVASLEGCVNPESFGKQLGDLIERNPSVLDEMHLWMSSTKSVGVLLSKMLTTMSLGPRGIEQLHVTLAKNLPTQPHAWMNLGFNPTLPLSFWDDWLRKNPLDQSDVFLQHEVGSPSSPWADFLLGGTAQRSQWFINQVVDAISLPTTATNASQDFQASLAYYFMSHPQMSEDMYPIVTGRMDSFDYITQINTKSFFNASSMFQHGVWNYPLEALDELLERESISNVLRSMRNANPGVLIHLMELLTARIEKSVAKNNFNPHVFDVFGIMLRASTQGMRNTASIQALVDWTVKMFKVGNLNALENHIASGLIGNALTTRNQLEEFINLGIEFTVDQEAILLSRYDTPVHVLENYTGTKENELKAKQTLNKEFALLQSKHFSSSLSITENFYPFIEVHAEE